MPQSFAQISDPHLSSLRGVRPGQLLSKRLLGYISWRHKRQHEHRPEVLSALQADLVAQAPELLLVTGDLTHIGLPSEFQQAAAWLRSLGNPQQIALIPGNHDSCVQSPWQETFALWADYMQTEEGELPAQPVADNRALFPSLRVRGEIAFIGLSTACPTAPGMASGSVGAAQLQRLHGVLEQTRNRGLFRVVYLHHCPLPGVEKWRKRLTDAPALTALLTEKGAELVLHGHGHRAHQHQLHSSVGSVPILAVPSASALGLHGADRAAYNRYQVQRVSEGWQLELCTHHYDPADASFHPGGSQTIAIERR